MAANMVVRTNVFSLNAHRNMKNVGLEQRRASNRLASGYRINSAADDAAGLAISENMRAQIRGLDQASRNAQDGQAMILTTEGGLTEIGNIMIRVRELLVQASNDTNTSDQRQMINEEISQLGREITSMQSRVEFNTNRVLDMGPSLPAGVMNVVADMEMSVEWLAVEARALSDLRSDIQRAMDLLGEMSATSATPATGAQGAAIAAGLAAFDPADAPTTALLTVSNLTNAGLDTAGTAGATVGETLVVLAERLAATTAAQTSVENASAQVRAGVAGNDVITRAHVAGQGGSGTVAHTGNNVAFFQVGANASQGVSYDFENVSRAVTAAAWTVRSVGAGMAAPATGSGIGMGIDISPMIGIVDQSITDINSVRANLGALQNRMDFTMRSLDISSENLSDAESRVRNADIAREMMRFTMTNVLQQAAVSMLSQANQIPQNLLQLLR